jgi:hypothetical protein
MHYTLFGASPSVTKYLLANGVDPDTQYLPDIKFLKRVYMILVSTFNYKVKITTEQFFKYGFAEQKMMLCLDTIQCVKNKHKEIKIQRSLSAKRSNLTRSADSSRYSKVSHSLGQNSNFKFERITPMKIAKVEQEKPDLRTPTKSLNVSFDIKTETSVAKKRDPQASQRLLGACKVPNRHSKQAGEALAQQQQPQAKP